MAWIWLIFSAEIIQAIKYLYKTPYNLPSCKYFIAYNAIYVYAYVNIFYFLYEIYHICGHKYSSDVSSLEMWWWFPRWK